MLLQVKGTMLLLGAIAGQNSGQEGAGFENHVWDVVNSWQGYTACALLAGGIVFAIYGWRISKVLAAINFGTIGGFAGHYLANRLVMNDIACTVGLAVLLGGLCVWQNRYGVALLAGGAGGVLGAALAYSLNLANGQPWIWAGFLLGFVTFALLAFIIYKVSAVLYSSVQGSILVVAGVLSLVSQTSMGEGLVTALRSRIYLLPIMLWVPTAASIVIQQLLLKRDPGWSIDK